MPDCLSFLMPTGDRVSVPSPTARASTWRRHPALLGAGLLILLTTATVTLLLWRSREDSFAVWQQHLGRLSAAVAEHAAQTFQGTHIVLDRVMDQVKAERIDGEEAPLRVLGARRMQETLRELAAPAQVIDVIAIAALDGRVVNSSLDDPPPRLDVTGAEDFRAFVADPALDVYWSAAIMNPATGRGVAWIARKIRDASGTAIGLSVVGIRTSHFERFYRSISLGARESAVLLLRDDAVLLTRYPPRPEAQVLSGRSSPSMQALITALAQGHGMAVVRTREP
jgi:hypothetical protein